jgi:hypothetical protein
MATTAERGGGTEANIRPSPGTAVMRMANGTRPIGAPKVQPISTNRSNRWGWAAAARTER